ncbi:MAG: S49 family peptidase [Sedimentisphaerales bacterium]|nr:S49 family peptidase [Sedimentisphaerales bacterium]
MRDCNNSLWQIEQNYIPEIRAMLEKIDLSGMKESSKRMFQLLAADNMATADNKGITAVLPLQGVIVQKEGVYTRYYGGTACETFKAWFDQVNNDPKVSRIVIDCNSPGGSTSGVQELSEHIFKTKTKPVVAVSNCCMASAAYHIASAADKVYASPSSDTGSIGVFCIHTDYTGYDEKFGIKTTLIKAGKYKAEGFGVLDDVARTALQESVNESYDDFVSSIARNRSVTKSAVINGYGEGRCLSAQKALKAGMVDGIKTLDDVLNLKFIRSKNNKSKAQALIDLEKIR